MDITDGQVREMRKALVDFGYSVDERIVHAEAEKVLAGETPDNIIGMFVKGFMRDAGMIPE